MSGPDGANHQLHPAGPRPHQVPRQTSPHVHPAPPQLQRYQPEPGRSIQPPWFEPPQPAFPQGPGQGARSPAPGRLPADGRRRATPSLERSADPSECLVENIPRTMTVDVPEAIEVRIAKADLMALADGLQGAGAAYRHDSIVTKALSVRLRAPEGGFWIETTSPETQWIENNHGLLSDDFASWRWTVTPQLRGETHLQLIVSARTVGTDGVAAETALPDQIIEVKVRTNYGQVASRWGSWLVAAAIGGFLAKFGAGIWSLVWALLAQFGVV